MRPDKFIAERARNVPRLPLLSMIERCTARAVAVRPPAAASPRRSAGIAFSRGALTYGLTFRSKMSSRRM
ncbi:MAG: hypothetical protein V9G29_07755 [Burkholderiaceae bacterium]